MSINTDMQLRHAFQVTSGAAPSSGNGEYWYGEIPTHWKLGRLKDFGSLLAGAGFPHEFQGVLGETLPFYKVGDLAMSRDNQGMGKSSNTISYKTAVRLRAHIVPAGAIVYAKIGAALLLNRRRIATVPCVIDNNMTAYIPYKEKLTSKWAFYWTSILDFGMFANPGAVPSLSEGSQAQLPIAIPSITEQHAIADYLDRETARLDALVAAKERMLKLLTERRRSLIAAAVTGGIDSARNAKLTILNILNEYESETSRRGDCASSVGDNGVNIAVATAEVSRRKLKHLASVNDDLLDENTDVKFEMQYIDIGNVDSSGRISEMSSFRFEDAPSRARRLVRDGDVIISTVRTYLQAITQIRNPPDNLVVSTGFAVVRPRQDRFDARYCRFALREPTFLAEVEKRSVGANYPAINVTDLADILIPVHSLPQQRAIADYLDREMALARQAWTVKIQGTIALLKERRAAIIASAVTGQIDVESAA